MPRGRPKKVEPVEEQKRFRFKSKFRDDRIRLKPPQVFRNEKGEKTIIPAVVAEFSRNDWATDDEELAALLRDKIKERAKRNPLHVQEV